MTERGSGDGTAAKAHTVTNLVVDVVDVGDDTVFGRTDAGTSVEGWVHGKGNLSVTADVSGDWVADVSGMTVIVSRGAGTWGPRMRLWRRGDILSVALKSGKRQKERPSPD